MPLFRRICIILFSLAFIFSACTPSLPSETSTPTPPVNVTTAANASGTKAPVPAVSSLNVDKAALRGVQVKLWHPWFGPEATLLGAQISKFNTENEWGIIVSAESKGNYSELFSQTDAALKDGTNPQIVIGFPEHALAWQDHILDLTPYVNDPLYGFNPSEISDFPTVIWDQDDVNGKRFGMPAQRTARFILYNQSWARELGFVSAPKTSSEFEEQACAAHRALSIDGDPNNDPLGGWLIDTNAMTPLSWMIAFGGGVQEEKGYRFLTPGNIAAFKFVKVLQQKNCAWVASSDLSPFERFASRQALFATASLEDFPDQARAFAAANSRDEWTVLKFPGDGHEALVVYGSSFIVFQSSDVTQLASWLFIRWILSAENQARWVESTGLFPLRGSTMTLLADYSASHPQWAEAVKLLPDGGNTPKLASWRNVRIMLEDGFRDMFDTIRHPDLTDGQVPLILKRMDDTAQDLNK